MELLQNTTTQDFKLFDESDERAAIYTSFLSVKGKTMFDAIVVKPRLAAQTSDDMEFWLDVHEEDIAPLRKHLRRYALRKNIAIEDISHVIKAFSIQTITGVSNESGNQEGFFFSDLQDNVEMFESEEFPGSMETDIAAFIDPRTSAQGVRVLCAEESFDFDEEIETTIVDDPSLRYDPYRMTVGVLEGSHEFGNQFPLNANLHQLNGVSFSKGCYIGQELTQRTYHTGVVRKVALPFLLDSLPKHEDKKIEVFSQEFAPLEMLDTGFDVDLKG